MRSSGHLPAMTGFRIPLFSELEIHEVSRLPSITRNNRNARVKVKSLF